MKLTTNGIRLLLFLQKHNEDRFMFSELNQMPYFRSKATLSRFLAYAEGKGLIKKTVITMKGRKYSCYEIKAWANDFVANLDIFV